MYAVLLTGEFFSSTSISIIYPVSCLLFTLPGVLSFIYLNVGAYNSTPDYALVLFLWMFYVYLFLCYRLDRFKRINKIKEIPFIAFTKGECFSAEINSF